MLECDGVLNSVEAQLQFRCWTVDPHVQDFWFSPSLFDYTLIHSICWTTFSLHYLFFGLNSCPLHLLTHKNPRVIFFFSFFFWEVTTLSVSTLAPTVCSVFPPPLPIVSLFNYLASLFSSALITLHSLSLYFYLFFFFFSFCIHPVRHSLLLSLCSLSCLFPLLHSTHGEAKPKKLSGYVLLSVRCRVGAH